MCDYDSHECGMCGRTFNFRLSDRCGVCDRPLCPECAQVYEDGFVACERDCDREDLIRHDEMARLAEDPRISDDDRSEAEYVLDGATALSVDCEPLLDRLRVSAAA